MSTYTPSLGLEEITPGDQAGLWGNTTNNNLTLIDQAVTGVTPINFGSLSGTTYTLTNFNGAFNEARSAVLNITGSATGSNTVVVPNIQKTYLVRNSTGQNVVFQTASPSASFTVAAGNSILIFCDGANNVFTGIASPSVGTLGVAGGGTGTTTFTAGFVKSTGSTNALTSAAGVALATEVTGTLPVANGGTGQASLTANNVILGNGTSAVQVVAPGTTGNVLTSTGATWISSAPTAAGIATVSGTLPIGVTSGANPVISLVGTVAIANGGTGSSTKNFVDLTTAQTAAGVKTFSNGINIGNSSTILRQGGSSGVDLFLNNTVGVATGVGFAPVVDNAYILGGPSFRWTVVYATTGTINTSDENQKTEISSLDDAEKRVATRIKGLIKKFKFKDAVAKKGSDGARIHVGVIAQEVQAAFAAEGLDAERYGLFCSDVLEDKSTRLGVRYEELLAFVIAAL